MKLSCCFHWNRVGRIFHVFWLGGLTPILGHGQGLGAPILPSRLSHAAEGEQGAVTRTMTLTPSITVDTLWTDNATLRSEKSSDLITSVAPGLDFSANGDRLKAKAKYSLKRVEYLRNSKGSETQQNLQSSATLEALENFAFIDYAGQIAQQSISAFGQQSADSVLSNANQTEVRTFSLSPYVKGMIADWADYQVKYEKSMSRSKSSFATDYDMGAYSALLKGRTSGRELSWSLDGSRTVTDYKSGRGIEADRLRSVLGYPVASQLVLSVIPGWESNNYASENKESRITWGVQADWSSERSKLSAMLEKRFFGKAHALSFEHRTQRTAWRFSDNKDASLSPDQLAKSCFGSWEDLPRMPSAEAQKLFECLVLNGGANSQGGFLSSGAMLRRQQNFSFTWLGLRDTVSLIATQTKSSRLFQTPGGQDDLTNSSKVQQRGLSLNYTRRLTPQTSLNVLAAHLRSTGDLSVQRTTLNSLNVSASTRLGLKTTATVGARHAVFDSVAAPYKENAVFGGIAVQF